MKYRQPVKARFIGLWGFAPIGKAAGQMVYPLPGRPQFDLDVPTSCGFKRAAANEPKMHSSVTRLSGQSAELSSSGTQRHARRDPPRVPASSHECRTAALPRPHARGCARRAWGNVARVRAGAAWPQFISASCPRRRRAPGLGEVLQIPVRACTAGPPRRSRGFRGRRRGAGAFLV